MKFQRKEEVVKESSARIALPSSLDSDLEKLSHFKDLLFSVHCLTKSILMYLYIILNDLP